MNKCLIIDIVRVISVHFSRLCSAFWRIVSVADCGESNFNGRVRMASKPRLDNYLFTPLKLISVILKIIL